MAIWSAAITIASFDEFFFSRLSVFVCLEFAKLIWRRLVIVSPSVSITTGIEPEFHAQSSLV